MFLCSNKVIAWDGVKNLNHASFLKKGMGLISERYIVRGYLYTICLSSQPRGMFAVFSFFSVPTGLVWCLVPLAYLLDFGK